MTAKIQNRYPGTQSFSSDQRSIFFGRDEDIVRLTEMIELEKMVLVYAKSGIGKTSLINAGVLPSLAQKNYYTFQSIRFGAYVDGMPSPNKLAEATLLKMRQEQNYLDKIIHADNSLWYFAKMWQLSRQNIENQQNETLLLILDQFEELFTFPTEQVNKFKQDLAELLFTNVPQRFIDEKEFLQDIKPDLLTPQEEKLLFMPLKVKILFAIRNDRMSQLNKMSDYIPRILLKHYELAPLTDAQALDAIRKPAQLDGNFATQKFTYDDTALESIMSFLTKEKTQSDNIESFQLQILCSVVERRVKEQKISTIHAKHIEPVKDIYQNFYVTLIDSLPIEDHKKLETRVMIENGLIEEATKRRLQLAKEQLGQKFKIQSDILERLVNERLLRTEERDNFQVYELAHDTLVEPILEAKKQREEKEEEQEQIRIKNEELRLANEKAEKERLEREKEAKRQRKVILMVGSVAVIAIVALIFAIILYFDAQNAKEDAITAQKDAENQKNIALKKEVEATEALNKLKSSEFKRITGEANQFLAAKNFADAVEKLNEAYLWTDDSLALTARIDSLRKIAGSEINFKQYTQKATELERSEKTWLEAIDLYDKASKLGYDDKSALNKKNALQSSYNQRLKYYQTKAQEYLNNKEAALGMFINPGLLLCPNDPVLLKLKKEIQK